MENKELKNEKLNDMPVKNVAGRQELSDDMLASVSGGSLWKRIKKAAKALGEGVKSLF